MSPLPISMVCAIMFNDYFYPFLECPSEVNYGGGQLPKDKASNKQSRIACKIAEVQYNGSPVKTTLEKLIVNIF